MAGNQTASASNNRPLIATIVTPNGKTEHREACWVETVSGAFSVGRFTDPKMPHLEEFQLAKTGNKIHAKGTDIEVKSIVFESGLPIVVAESAGTKIGFSYGKLPPAPPATAPAPTAVTPIGEGWKKKFRFGG